MDTCKKKKQQVDPNVASCIVSHTVNWLFIVGQTHRQAFEMIHVKKNHVFHTHTNTNTHGRAVNCTLSLLSTHTVRSATQWKDSLGSEDCRGLAVPLH